MKKSKEKILLSLLSRNSYNAKELVELLELKDTRELRKMIQSLREQGYFIKADVRGYRIAKSKSEFNNYLKMAFSMLRTYSKMIRNAGKQFNLKLFVNNERVL